jgi:predicted transcriptional regulator of viral defense system
MLTISKLYIYFLKVGDNMLYDYLIENYEEDEPIFLTDINIEGMTEENIRYHLKKLTDNGTICRFDSGIYYLPRVNIFGEKSVLSAETVALHKYILRKGKRIGFYSGYTLANRMGISMQVPFKEEITSNYAPAQVREISIKNRKYVIRRPVIEITEENAYVLQLLDCLKDIDKSAEEDMKVCGKILSQYSKEHKITKEQIDKFLEYYPIKIYKAIYETGVEYVFA